VRGKDFLLGTQWMLYVIRAGGTNHYKIGFTSRCVESRVMELQTGNPLRLSVVFTLDGDESDEALWHMKFAHKMTGATNEWFELTESDLKEFKDVKTTNDQGSVIRSSAFDVRSVRGGQQYPATARRENVSRQQSAFDTSVNQSVLIVGGRKYVKRDENVFRIEAVANDCDGDQGVHDDNALRHTDP
jgi:hypothetical protein